MKKLFRLEEAVKRRKGLDPTTAEMLGDLSVLERRLAETHTVVEIRGKVCCYLWTLHSYLNH